MSPRGAASAGELPVMLFKTLRRWEAWLEKNEDKPGVWLQLAKKEADLVSITYAEALEVALCFGWIDSQKKRHDDSSWLQKFTPRGPRSIWSKVNREAAERLMADGRMRPAGVRAVERARETGQWERAYDSHRTAAVPDDLTAALKRNPAARRQFETLDGTNRYAILWRLQTAVRPETRERRLRQFVDMLARGETLHPARPKRQR